ncbi:hypothetical protein [Colwellia hornerae]|uniref:Uncharacterized protein n=1 Tax=Colwellia hornerae TaxID=89402 RepID=A0A5C6Q3Q5_9GAMM|nr:hypothetical protein [Colwellia hornerae]TWX52166.1 hypothetical protein ESZ28_13085 [Colwellia hornerae]TWX57515.1 hypothetical protein ESZ26_13050 [Colwellia hornerae]TWX63382.1 hypothetical protein ESZ27_17015 [Colwellia hornerae]
MGSSHANTYGKKAFVEFNDTFKLSTSYIKLKDYDLQSSSSKQFILKDVEGNILTFDKTEQGWKLNVDKSLEGVVLKEAKQLIAFSIGAYLSLISKIKCQ